MSQLYKDQIYWIEVDKISPNPYQPRNDFDEDALANLADSIRQYGIMQPLTVTRVEEVRPEGGMDVRYELIAGERRWRAAQLAGLNQVPVIVRKGDDSKVKLELAIIENLQREDLNPMDRALAFDRLAVEFTMSHTQIAKKMGKSREYVSNTLRLLQLPDDIKQALRGRLITEGHTRPLLMLKERPDQQQALFKEIVYKKMSVREAERVARSIAKEKARKALPEELQDPALAAIKRKFEETLGTRVKIEKNRGNGGKLVIDYFSPDDLDSLLEALRGEVAAKKMHLPEMQEMLAQATGLDMNTDSQKTVAAPSLGNTEIQPLTQEARPEPVATDKNNDMSADNTVDMNSFTGVSEPMTATKPVVYPEVPKVDLPTVKDLDTNAGSLVLNTNTPSSPAIAPINNMANSNYVAASNLDPVITEQTVPEEQVPPKGEGENEVVTNLDGAVDLGSAAAELAASFGNMVTESPVNTPEPAPVIEDNISNIPQNRNSEDAVAPAINDYLQVFAPAKQAENTQPVIATKVTEDSTEAFNKDRFTI